MRTLVVLIALTLCVDLAWAQSAPKPGQGDAGNTAQADAVVKQDESQRWVCVDAVPVQVGDKFPGHILRRGDRVTLSDQQSGEPLQATFDLGGKQIAVRIAHHVLSRRKPAVEPLPANKPANDEPLTDAARLQGSWTVVGVSLLGKINPGPMEMIDTTKAAVPLVAGFPGNAPGLGAMPAMMLNRSPQYYRFEGDAIRMWNVIPTVNERGEFKEESMGYPEIWEEVHLDPKTNPKRLDLVAKAKKKNLRQTLPGIYEFDGELLKWAQPVELTPAMSGAAEARIEARRPQGFDTQHAAGLRILWLSRFNEREVPPPPIAKQKKPAKAPGQGVF